MERAEHSAARMAALFGVSLLLHAALVTLLGRAPAALPPPAVQPLEVAVVEKPAPPPPAPAPPVRMKFARAPKRATQDLPPPPALAQPRPPSEAPPPPSREAPQEPVVLPGITLESTSQGGSFAVSAGNTLYGQPSRTANDSEAAKPYK